jgi:hypothetical protein
MQHLQCSITYFRLLLGRSYRSRFRLRKTKFQGNVLGQYAAKKKGKKDSERRNDSGQNYLCNSGYQPPGYRTRAIFSSAETNCDMPVSSN